MAPKTRVQSQVESYQRLKKMVLDASLLNTQDYKVRIKGKVKQLREGVAPSPTPWCSSYRKGSLRVTLDYGRQLYFTVVNVPVAFMIPTSQWTENIFHIYCSLIISMVWERKKFLKFSDSMLINIMIILRVGFIAVSHENEQKTLFFVCIIWP